METNEICDRVWEELHTCDCLFQLKYYHEIGQVISCSNHQETALVIGKYICINKNVL